MDDAEEALAEAAFRTGDFTRPEELFSAALARSTRDGDRLAEARAIGGLGMTHHYRNITALLAGDPVDGDAIVAEEELMRQSLDIWLETRDSAGTALGMFGVGLVFQVLHRDWSAAMPYFWQAYGLAEAVEDSGDLYGASEIHRHVGFYYLVEDVRPVEAVRRLRYSLELRERLGDIRRIPSGLVALGHAELAADNPGQAVEVLRRGVAIAREAQLLPEWTRDAEETLRQAEATAS